MRPEDGMTGADRRPRAYFSLRSPYAWLAHHDLMTQHPDVVAGIEWRPFWEPDTRSAAALRERGARFPYVDMSRAKRLYILQDVRRLARERGLDITWPVDREPVWEIPHLAYFAAADSGKSVEFITRFLRARWLEGIDICSPATVKTLCTELGLRGHGGELDDRALRNRGVDALVTCCEDGVFGVPFYIVGFDRFWGLDRVPAFVRALRAQEHQEPRDSTDTRVVEAAMPELAADHGHAGGCG